MQPNAFDTVGGHLGIHVASQEPHLALKVE